MAALKEETSVDYLLTNMINFASLLRSCVENSANTIYTLVCRMEVIVTVEMSLDSMVGPLRATVTSPVFYSNTQCVGELSEIVFTEYYINIIYHEPYNYYFHVSLHVNILGFCILVPKLSHCPAFNLLTARVYNSNSNMVSTPTIGIV